MKRSKSGREVAGEVESARAGSASRRPSPENDPGSSGTILRIARVLAIVAVVIVPFLVSSFLTDSGGEAPTPRVTELLESASESPSGNEALGDDSPVTDGGDGKDVDIRFRRGRRVALGTMRVPAIGLTTKFYDGVVDEAVERGPGHWPGTPWPGEPGNSVFAGHRTTFTHPFADLDLVERGARVLARVRNGTVITYRVFKTSIVPEAEYADFVLEQPRGKHVRTITLFACTPKGFRTHRIVVQARALPTDASGSDQGRGKAMALSS